MKTKHPIFKVREWTPWAMRQSTTKTARLALNHHEGTISTDWTKEVLLFTGIEDSNSKPIYEGDTVITSDGGTSGRVVVERGTWVMRYDTGRVGYYDLFGMCEAGEITLCDFVEKRGCLKDQPTRRSRIRRIDDLRKS